MMHWFSILARCVTSLYDFAFMLSITERIRMSVLCDFSCAFSIHGEGFVSIRCFIFVYL